MTIFHIIRYPPAELVHEYLYTDALWEDLFPDAIAKTIRVHLYGQHRTYLSGKYNTDEYEEQVTKVLLEYEGPLE